MKSLRSVLVVLIALAVVRLEAPAAELNAVPGQVQFAGRVNLTTEDTGDTEVLKGVTFSLFNEQSGGAALWVETQNVGVGEGGYYSALLGAATQGGIPQDIFSSGEARWHHARGEPHVHAGAVGTDVEALGSDVGLGAPAEGDDAHAAGVDRAYAEYQKRPEDAAKHPVFFRRFIVEAEELQSAPRLIEMSYRELEKKFGRLA